MSKSNDASQSARHGKFNTTRWSLVLSAGRESSPDARSALETLCQLYWKPLYAYVRRRVTDVHEAQDLTQAFFVRLLERNTFAFADPARGRFRTFLLTSLQNFLANEWKKATSQKRGGEQVVFSLDFASVDSRGGFEPAVSEDAERAFAREWATTLLAYVLARLRKEYADADKEAHFDRLKQFLSGSDEPRAHRTTAEALGMSEGAVRTAAHRMRKRYRQLLRDEIAQSVADPEQVEEELRELFAALGS